MADKNVRLAYLLAFLKNSWFWLGIWVFYYLRFTDYSGIGLIETVLIITFTLTEIPTGAIADLLGKRKILVISFFLQGLGGLLMGLSPSFGYLALSVLISSIGVVLYSGTLESLVFDSLKEQHRESEYGKAISNINTLCLISPAVCGAIGGYMYIISPSLPFITSGVLCLIGAVASLFFTEPDIDTEKFNLKNFLVQTSQGIKQLFKTIDVKKQTWSLLLIGFVVIIADEMLNSFLGVEFGFDPKQIGLFWGLIYLVSAFGSKFTPNIYSKLGEKFTLFLTGLVIAISLVVSPVLGLILGGASLLIRSTFQAIYYNLASININKHTESKYRATTLSTFNMLRNIPYAISAFFLGTLADIYSAKTLAVFLGIFLLFTLFLQNSIFLKKVKYN